MTGNYKHIYIYLPETLAIGVINAFSSRTGAHAALLPSKEKKMAKVGFYTR